MGRCVLWPSLCGQLEQGLIAGTGYRTLPLTPPTSAAHPWHFPARQRGSGRCITCYICMWTPVQAHGSSTNPPCLGASPATPQLWQQDPRLLHPTMSSTGPSCRCRASSPGPAAAKGARGPRQPALPSLRDTVGGTKKKKIKANRPCCARCCSYPCGHCFLTQVVPHRRALTAERSLGGSGDETRGFSAKREDCLPRHGRSPLAVPLQLIHTCRERHIPNTQSGGVFARTRRRAGLAQAS